MVVTGARRPVRVLSLYEGFFSGGARVLHSAVVGGLHAAGRQEHSVLALHRTVLREATLQHLEDDPRYQALRAAGVEVATLGRTPDDAGREGFTAAELERAARAARSADLVLSLKEQPLRLVLEDAFPRVPVVVCLHRSDPEGSGPALDRLREAVAAGRVVGAVCCAESTRDAYAAAGLPRDLLHVVPNGVDLTRFRPVGHRRRAALRGALGVPPDATVVTLSARYDPMKDVPLFLRGARVLLAADARAHVLLCGAGMSAANPALLADVRDAFADRPDLLGRVHLLGVRRDMPLVWAASDVAALTSAWGEAAPLSLIEGAVCGAVPVTTAVGDAARIVDGVGLVVPRDPVAAATAWAEAAARRPGLVGVLSAARPRFSQARMLAGYAVVLERARRDAVAPVAAV